MHEEVNPRRSLPAVSKVVDALGETDLPRPVILEAIRTHLVAARKSGRETNLDVFVQELRDYLEQHRRNRLQIVVNATGIVLHTNLGRAPLHPEVAQEMAFAASTYGNVELDLAGGRRGNRAAYLEHHLAVLCGAEAATVVNNCAAALVLIVKHFVAARPEVLISRGELVQIGGGFRIGEIVTAAGARLREVGATNQTSLEDYEKAIGPDTALILSVHRSNFFMEGFVKAPEPDALAALARRKKIPLVADLGTGALSEMSDVSTHPEPTPGKTIKAGVDLVCFSGDKLFGGPQAGIIAGRARFVRALKKNPFYRALRCDKIRLIALQSTVDLHLREDDSQIPALSLLRTSKDELRARAAVIFERLRGLPLRVSVGRASGKTGGGTLPRALIPSVTLDISPGIGTVESFAETLRRHAPPVIGYIGGGVFKLDLRTVFPFQDDILVDALRSACVGVAD